MPLWIAVLAGAGSLSAQTSYPLLEASPGSLSLCNSEQLAAAKQLSFGQLACWHASELLSPWAAVRAGFSSGLGQLRNNPYLKAEDGDDYAHRFAAYYAMRSARETGELLAGFLNHEDPRPHPSGETTFKKRARSALLSVLIVRGDENNRPAFAPIVGSLASGFAGAACYRVNTGPGYAFEQAGIAYSGYFGKALYREFRPDISFYVKRMLHKKPD